MSQFAAGGAETGGAAAGEIERLEALDAGEPAGPGFAALAEAQRRAGRPEDAFRIAESGLRAQPKLVAGRVALGLALLDLDRLEEARAELERALEDAPGHPLAESALEATGPGVEEARAFSDLAERELEDAFQEAEAQPEEMVDANSLAESALRRVERGAAEGGFAPLSDAAFATETVAGLLEDQGFSGQAQAVRDTMAGRAGSGQINDKAGHKAGDEADHTAVVETLERWLHNLRRGSP